MDLKAKLEELISQAGSVGTELNLVTQRAGILQSEMIGIQANINLLLQLDPSLKQVIEQARVAAAPSGVARPQTNKPVKESKANG